MNLEEQAKKISKLIAEVDTDHRGNLLVLVGNDLRLQAQGFTGNLIRSTGYEYGVDPKKPGHPNFK